MGAHEKALESEAAEVLSRLLGGQVAPRDVPPAQGERDFDLVDEQMVPRVAVEVTSVQLPRARATQAQMTRIRQQDVGLQQSWTVAVHEESDLSAAWLSRVVSLLNELTQLGVSAFGAPYGVATGPTEALVAQLARLTIVQGRAMPDSLPPLLHPAGYGSGSLDPVNLAIAVETEIGKADNRRKLRAAPSGAERHMFVWLHDSNWYISSILRDGWGLPSAVSLPPEVDVVWMGVSDGDPPICSALVRVDAAGLGAVDPRTGAPLAITGQFAPTGPPASAPSCPVCGATGCWSVQPLTRHDPSTDGSEVFAAWTAACSVDADHWSMPGRPLNEREL